MKKVLIICARNCTRSPLACDIANNIARCKQADISFDSAGLVYDGDEIDTNTRQALSEIGIVSFIRPKKLIAAMADKYDEFQVMSDNHRSALIRIFGNSFDADKIRVLNFDNPTGKGIDAYRECRTKMVEFYKEYIK